MHSLIKSLLIMAALPSYTLSYADTATSIYGAYPSDNQSMLPLILKLDDTGTWQQIKSIASLPPKMSGLNVTSSTCSHFGCVAIGTYQVTKKLWHGLLLVSNDQANWQAIDQINGLPNLSNMNGMLIQSKCDESSCIVAGYQSNLQHTVLKPLLLVTQGNDTSWQAASISGLPAMTTGYLNNLAYSGNNAIAVGGYQDSSNQWQPLLLISHDHGTTWSVNQSITGLPKNYIDFQSITCTENNCVMEARNVIDDNQTKPAFLTSDDGGNAWHYVDKVNLPADFYNGDTLGINCQHGRCIAVGDYTTSSRNDLTTFILVSDDNGHSWNDVKNLPVLPKTTIQMTPVSISCMNDTSCLIETSYITEVSEDQKPHAHPLLFSATLNNDAWTFTRVDNNLPALDSLILISAACNNANCLVAGAYKSSNTASDFSAVLFSSKDGGNNWIIDSGLNLPLNSYFDMIV